MDTITLYRIVRTVAEGPHARHYWAGHLPRDLTGVDLGVGLDAVCRLALCRWPADGDEVVETARGLGIDPDRLVGLWVARRG